MWYNFSLLVYVEKFFNMETWHYSINNLEKHKKVLLNNISRNTKVWALIFIKTLLTAYKVTSVWLFEKKKGKTSIWGIKTDIENFFSLKNIKEFCCENNNNNYFLLKRKLSNSNIKKLLLSRTWNLEEVYPWNYCVLYIHSWFINKRKGTDYSYKN